MNAKGVFAMVPYTSVAKSKSQTPQLNPKTSYYENPQGELYKIINSNLPDSIKARLYSDLMQRHLTNVGRYSVLGGPTGSTVDTNTQTEMNEFDLNNYTTPVSRAESDVYAVDRGSLIKNLFGEQEIEKIDVTPVTGNIILDNMRKIKQLDSVIDKSITDESEDTLKLLRAYGLVQRGQKITTKSPLSKSAKKWPKASSFVHFLTYPGASTIPNYLKAFNEIKNHVKHPEQLKSIITNPIAYQKFSNLYYKNKYNQHSTKKPMPINTSDLGTTMQEENLQVGSGITRRNRHNFINSWTPWR